MSRSTRTRRRRGWRRSAPRCESKRRRRKSTPSSCRSVRSFVSGCTRPHPRGPRQTGPGVWHSGRGAAQICTGPRRAATATAATAADHARLPTLRYLLRLFHVEKEVATLHASSASARSAAEADVARHDEIEEAVKSHDVQKAKLGRKAVDLERKAVKLREELEGKTVRAGPPPRPPHMPTCWSAPPPERCG